MFDLPGVKLDVCGSSGSFATSGSSSPQGDRLSCDTLAPLNIRALDIFSGVRAHG
jgi:hypothetical protein